MLVDVRGRGEGTTSGRGVASLWRVCGEFVVPPEAPSEGHLRGVHLVGRIKE